MLVYKNNQRASFVFKYNPTFIDHVKKLRGSRYIAANRCWDVDTTWDSVDLAKRFGMPVDQRVIECLPAEEKPLLDIDREIVTISDPVPWRHQLEMVACGREIVPACLWHCGMGTGKTRAAIDYIQTMKFEWVLIVCPLAVADVWQKQIGMYHLSSPAVRVLNKGGVAKKLEKAKTINKGIVVINYESLWREPFASWALKQKWDLIIADECHAIKSPGSRVSRYMAKMVNCSHRRLGLSGTPLAHSILDAYGLYRFLQPSIFGTNYHRFKTYYGVWGGYEGRQVIAYQNTEDFYRKFDSIRVHVKREVLDLPPALFHEMTFELPPSAMKIYKQLEKDFFVQVEAGEVTATNALVKLLRLQQITSGYLPFEDKVEPLHNAKADTLEHVLSGLDNREPVVVFCRFKHDLAAVHTVCKKLGRTSSELSGAVKQLAEWQAGDTDVLAAQIRTAREGIDLTRACYNVYYSLGFSLAEYEQSTARSHRPGQSRTVFYYNLIALNTIDVKVYAALKKRKNIIDEILKST